MKKILFVNDIWIPILLLSWSSLSVGDSASKDQLDNKNATPLVFNQELDKQEFESSQAKGQDYILRTVVLRPSEDGRAFSIYPNNAAPHASYFASHAGTWGGKRGIVRSFVKFDLSPIPRYSAEDDNYITDATLYLYHHPNVKHSGNNRSEIHMVFYHENDWHENTLNWNNQPTGVIPSSKRTLASSTSPTQDYQLDVGENLYTKHKYGGQWYDATATYRLKLEHESPYANLYFASSDYPDASKHPKLVVTYIEPRKVTIYGTSFVLVKRHTRRVTYRASVKGGTAKSYTWRFNGSHVGSGSSYTHTFRYIRDGYTKTNTLTLKVVFTDNKTKTVTKYIKEEHLDPGEKYISPF